MNLSQYAEERVTKTIWCADVHEKYALIEIFNLDRDA